MENPPANKLTDGFWNLMRKKQSAFPPLSASNTPERRRAERCTERGKYLTDGREAVFSQIPNTVTALRGILTRLPIPVSVSVLNVLSVCSDTARPFQGRSEI